jgi:hypothetical protein
VWEACRATSAATTFFDPVAIGKRGQKFIDGALRYNNPIQQAYNEAKDLWPDRDTFIISIGTGSAPGPVFGGSLKNIVEGMKAIVTQTEQTAQDFNHSHRELVDNGLLFRFNVYHGLKSIGLQEFKEIDAIADATEHYLDQRETGRQLSACVRNLSNLIASVPAHFYPDRDLLSRRSQDSEALLRKPAHSHYSSTPDFSCSGLPNGLPFSNPSGVPGANSYYHPPTPELPMRAFTDQLQTHTQADHNNRWGFSRATTVNSAVELGVPPGSMGSAGGIPRLMSDSYPSPLFNRPESALELTNLDRTCTDASINTDTSVPGYRWATSPTAQSISSSGHSELTSLDQTRSAAQRATINHKFVAAAVRAKKQDCQQLIDIMAVEKTRSLLDAESINTALMQLCMSREKDEKRRVKALEAILNRSTPDFHCRDGTDGRTPLIWAISLNHVATWRLLIARGCGVTATDRDFDRTPLMWAAEKGSWLATEAILGTFEGRRLINVRDIEGKTALDLAEQRGHHKTCQLLLDHGAEKYPSSAGSAPLLVELPGTGDMSG